MSTRDPTGKYQKYLSFSLFSIIAVELYTAEELAQIQEREAENGYS